MKPTSHKPQRCAIYTRKSTEHNLDLAFNSLDAQREACEAYIKSQAHEGWLLVPDRFDDGGLSGASLARPALQNLLEEVRARKIDIIVVYKVDRLTRSLADFAKLVELFDQHEVSFVSVTQSFNTTSSMGRLTLNVLLSFAQFEREVIGERVRDKIAASKRKGIWVGGPIPLGYRSVDKKIQIVPEEAALVCRIFSDYLRLGSIGELAASLDREGIRPKPRPLANGRAIAAKRFNIGPLAHMLKNRFYIGEVSYRDEIHQGKHAAILDRELFDAVQRALADRGVQRKQRRINSNSILTGLIFDDRGNPMSPSHSCKQGVRYRYYVSQAILQNCRAEAGTVARVSAPDVEAIVSNVIRDKMAAERPAASAGVNRAMSDPVPNEPTFDCEFVLQHVQRVIIHRSEIEIIWRPADSAPDDTPTAQSRKIPFEPSLPLKKGIAHSPAGARLDPRSRESLLQTIARAHQWVDEIVTGKAQSLDEIAAQENLVERYVRRLSVLAFLSPKIIRAILDGTAPADLTVTSLTQALPYSWVAQEQMFAPR